MELKGNIKDYTLNRFIEEVGVEVVYGVFRNSCCMKMDRLRTKPPDIKRCRCFQQFAVLCR